MNNNDETNPALPSHEPGAPALVNGLRILEMIAAADHPVGFNRIAESLTVSRASVVRLLRVLQQEHYVCKDESSGKYIPGSSLAALSPRSAMRAAFAREAAPILLSLVGTTANTALALFWNGRQIVCVAKENHQASVPMQDIGTRRSEFEQFPWGAFFYGILDITSREQYLDSVAEPGSTARQRLESWLEQYRAQGYIYDNAGVIEGLRRITSPVVNERGDVIGAIGIGGNPHSLPDERVEQASGFVRSHAHRLSNALGFSGDHDPINSLGRPAWPADSKKKL